MTIEVPVSVLWFTAGFCAATVLWFGLAWWFNRRKHRG